MRNAIAVLKLVLGHPYLIPTILFSPPVYTEPERIRFTVKHMPNCLRDESPL